MQHFIIKLVNGLCLINENGMQREEGESGAKSCFHIGEILLLCVGREGYKKRNMKVTAVVSFHLSLS